MNNEQIIVYNPGKHRANPNPKYNRKKIPIIMELFLIGNIN